MRITKFAICLMAILFAPSVPAIPSPGNELTVSVDLEATRQPGPLQIVGFKMPEEMSAQSFWFEVRISCANPANKLEAGPVIGGLGPSKNPQDAQWPKESTIAPGAQGEADVSGLRFYHLVFSARAAACSCLRASVRVSNVEFADGCKWERALATNSGPDPTDDADTQQSLLPCRESQESAKVLEDLELEADLRPVLVGNMTARFFAPTR
jgi:hypothetical protein